MWYIRRMSWSKFNNLLTQRDLQNLNLLIKEVNNVDKPMPVKHGNPHPTVTFDRCLTDEEWYSSENYREICRKTKTTDALTNWRNWKKEDDLKRKIGGKHD